MDCPNAGSAWLLEKMPTTRAASTRFVGRAAPQLNREIVGALLAGGHLRGLRGRSQSQDRPGRARRRDPLIVTMRGSAFEVGLEAQQIFRAALISRIGN